MVNDLWWDSDHRQWSKVGQWSWWMIYGETVIIDNDLGWDSGHRHWSMVRQWS